MDWIRGLKDKVTDGIVTRMNLTLREILSHLRNTLFEEELIMKELLSHQEDMDLSKWLFLRTQGSNLSLRRVSVKVKRV